jgi:subtilisin family serine protease
VLPLDNGRDNPIADRVLRDPNATYDVSPDGVVVAIKAELLVRKPARKASAELHDELSKIARNCGTLASILTASAPGAYRLDDSGPAGEVEVWRLIDPQGDSIDEARRLRVLADDMPVKMGKGPVLLVPAVSPNHVSIPSAEGTGCPAGPPHPAPPPPEPFVRPLASGKHAKVVVIDSGYIQAVSPDPSHATLDARVQVEAGYWLDTLTDTPTWRPNPADGPDTNCDGQLDGIAGHGTFIAGLIASMCPEAEITVVGQRDEEISIEGLNAAQQSKLFASEIAIAHAILLHGDADVIQCGFAFPTIDDYPPLPFIVAMQLLTGPDAPRPGVAVVAPAGNESSRRRHWPAALPGVIAVAATNRRGNRRAWFSNWGQWCDCCTRGEDVYSTFIDWEGPIEGEPHGDIEDFKGWARWDGTSFAAPKVSAAIACVLAAGNAEMLPVDAWELLVGGTAGTEVTELTDQTLSGLPGVTLPYLQLG